MGLEVPARFEGHSLVPLIRGEADAAYPYAHLFGTYPDLRRGMRAGRYKYIEHVPTCPRRTDWPERELYDLIDDPREEEDVLDSHQDLAGDLRSTMQSWVRSKLGGRPDPMVEQARQGFLKYDN
jgi:hypothetical protein